MFECCNKPLDTAALRASLLESAAGALVVFEGWVRNENEGQSVTSLTYEAAGPLCQTVAEEIFVEARAKFDVIGVRVAHRVGHVAVGEVAVWIGVTAAHRDAAFAACRYVIDELKNRLPVWKKEFYSHSAPQWIGT